MTRRFSAILATGLGMLCMLCLPVTSQAQAVYGNIIGNVTDNTGAAIPGATITVTDTAKGTSVEEKSGASGEYTVGHLIPDVYDIKVTFQGFQTWETKGIQVFADTTQKVDSKLTVGGESQTIEVSSDSVPVLQTDRAEVSTVFNAKTVDELPIGDRNFTNLQLLLPGAQTLSWSHAASENPQASKQIQIDGQAFGGVAFQLDGTDNQDPILGIIVINPALDAVGETKITTQNFDAEFGKAVSSIVTAQTKSGGNRFHGSAFDYRQSNANLARDPFTQSADAGPFPGGLYNQFGGSVGGPILKDKLFFFGDYQGLRQKVGISQVDTIPTTHLLNTCLGTEATVTGAPGCDFNQYTNINGTKGSGQLYQQVGGASVPYAGNVIPAAQISPQALNFLKLLQPYVANVGGSFANGLANNYAQSGIGGFNTDQWDERIDFTLNEKIHLFERFSRFTDLLTGTEMFGAAGGPGFGYQGYGGTSRGANDSVAAGVDISLSNTLLTDIRAGYYRYDIVTSKYDQGTDFATGLGIPGLNTGSLATSGAPAIQIDMPGANGLFGTGLNVNHCNCPLTEKEDQFQIVNNWTKIIGTHSVKIGADLRYARNLRVPSDSNRTGQLEFTGNPTSNPNLGGTGELPTGGLGLASFLLGDVANIQRYVSVSTNAKEFQKRLFFYAQDTWRATPNLTVNYGLRYELYSPESVNAVGNGSLMNLKDGYLRVAGVGGIGKNMNWNPAAFPLNPRLGVAYQMDPKTVIRAGYGRSFDIGVFGSIFGHVVTQNLPVLANQQLEPLGGATSYAFCLGPSVAGGCQQPAGQPVAGGPSAYVSPAPEANGLLPAPGYAVNNKTRPNDLRLPTIDAWNLSVQRAITPTLALTVAYVANKGTHTLSAGDGNNTNPNETALVLPAEFSVVGQPLHWDPTVANTAIYSAAFPQFPGIAPDGGTQTAKYLERYYGGSLAACQDPAYVAEAAAAGAAIPNPGACGWTNGISNYGDDQDSHYNALQITLAKQLTKGLQFTTNYAWQRGFDFNSGYATFDRHAVKGRNNDIREQQIVMYGNYTLPFGRNAQFASNAPRWLDEVIGNWQLSPVLNWSSGLPFTLNYNGCNSSVGGTSAPCYVNGRAGFLQTHLTDFDPATHTRNFYRAQTVGGTGTATPFTAPGLDQIGNMGRNSNFGPAFFNTDLALQKNFPIHESLLAQFRVDAANVFNHINPGLGGGGPTYNIESDTNISGEAPGAGPRQLKFSLRVQF